MVILDDQEKTANSLCVLIQQHIIILIVLKQMVFYQYEYECLLFVHEQQAIWITVSRIKLEEKKRKGATRKNDIRKRDPRFECSYTKIGKLEQISPTSPSVRGIHGEVHGQSIRASSSDKEKQTVGLQNLADLSFVVEWKFSSRILQ